MTKPMHKKQQEVDVKELDGTPKGGICRTCVNKQPKFRAGFVNTVDRGRPKGFKKKKKDTLMHSPFMEALKEVYGEVQINSDNQKGGSDGKKR